MSTVKTNLRVAHVFLTLSLNEENYRWSDPRVETNIEISLPLEMFDCSNFSKMVKAQLEALVPALNAEKTRVEEDARVKAELEAVQVTN